MLEKLKSLWETAKTTLHYGPSTEPLWTHVVELLHNFEARIAALEGQPATIVPIEEPESSTAEDKAVSPSVKLESEGAGHDSEDTTA